ncbi:Phosphopantetheine-binding protein [Candidatus Terasakiella magnetica]|uniref:Phosphopantetheine-binding protein n=1 Tax=Candidatus Terasakiella magnetica TaxID=1867952 RepID=A0A1C3RH90_9PROT|nr:phosphopantetheine-binding protein [Candidatus Terasakiella magnetica]SCA56657.1 Phosphopantetheine-binding protein [Candidatus Terasakiella magnetica]
MDELELELKKLIIEALNLEDLEPEEIESSERLFVEGLGLDSIDALELGMEIQKKYGIKINSETENIKTHFASVANLAKFISSEKEG